MAEKTYSERVYDIVRKIPSGKVLSYGRIAYMLGDFSGFGPRAVGNAMRRAPGGLPCHRVVRQDGTPAFINGFEELLRLEGVAFRPDGKIDMAASCWKPTTD